MAVTGIVERELATLTGELGPISARRTAWQIATDAYHRARHEASLLDPDRLFVRRLVVEELDRLHARLLGVEL